jgi:hypothetical protein
MSGKMKKIKKPADSEKTLVDGELVLSERVREMLRDVKATLRKQRVLRANQEIQAPSPPPETPPAAEPFDEHKTLQMTLSEVRMLLRRALEET